VSGDHLLGSHEKADGRRERKVTVFVRVLNTRIVPADVPMKTYLPDGSNRATVIAALVKLVHTLP
jgi:hypothetical protein